MGTFIQANNVQSGPYSDEQIEVALNHRIYSLEDLGWREGMIAWQPLHSLYPHVSPAIPPPIPHQTPEPFPSKTFHVIFGSAGLAVDEFGFVRNGTLQIEPSLVAVAGPNHWPVIIRVLIYPVLFLLFVACGMNLFALFIPIALIHYFCASGAKLEWRGVLFTDVNAVGRVVSFLAPRPKSAKRKKCVFRTKTESEAAEIVRLLNRVNALEAKQEMATGQAVAGEVTLVKQFRSRWIWITTSILLFVVPGLIPLPQQGWEVNFFTLAGIRLYQGELVRDTWLMLAMYVAVVGFAAFALGGLIDLLIGFLRVKPVEFRRENSSVRSE